MIDSDALARICANAAAAIAGSDRSGGVSERRAASTMWQRMFQERENFPDANAFMVFRRSGATYGVGDPRYESAAAAERMARRFSNLLALEKIDDRLPRSIPEPTLGAPLVFRDPRYDVARSPNFLKNYANAHRLLAFLRGRPARGKLRICEIGAGYGALAYMLCSALDVESYTIVDLPENLYLSSVYLQALFPDRRATFLDSTPRRITDGNLSEHPFLFTLPQHIDQIATEYDLVINIDSLGEMNLKTAQAYAQWIEAHLKRGGVFHTDNRIRTQGIDGAQRIRDLQYDRFAPVALAGMLSPTSFLNQMHHQAFLTRRDPAQPPDRDAFDALGFLFHVGLSISISPLSEGLCAGTLTPQDQAFLGNILGFFTERSVAAKRGRLADLGTGPYRPIVSYLTALLDLAEGEHRDLDRLLNEFLADGPKDHAGTIALVIQALFDESPRQRRREECSKLLASHCPHLESDIREHLDGAHGRFTLRNHARELLNLEGIRYRTHFVRQLIRMSGVQRFANVLSVGKRPK